MFSVIIAFLNINRAANEILFHAMSSVNLSTQKLKNTLVKKNQRRGILSHAGDQHAKGKKVKKEPPTVTK